MRNYILQMVLDITRVDMQETKHGYFIDYEITNYNAAERVEDIDPEDVEEITYHKVRALFVTAKNNFQNYIPYRKVGRKYNGAMRIYAQPHCYERSGVYTMNFIVCFTRDILRYIRHFKKNDSVYVTIPPPLKKGVQVYSINFQSISFSHDDLDLFLYNVEECEFHPHKYFVPGINKAKLTKFFKDIRNQRMTVSFKVEIDC